MALVRACLAAVFPPRLILREDRDTLCKDLVKLLMSSATGGVRGAAALGALRVEEERLKGWGIVGSRLRLDATEEAGDAGTTVMLCVGEFVADEIGFGLRWARVD